MDAVGLHNVADERGHRNAAVLDLSLAEEANRGLLANRELVVLDHVHRVPVADNRVQLLGELLQVANGLHDGRGSALHHGRDGAGVRESGRVESKHSYSIKKGDDRKICTRDPRAQRVWSELTFAGQGVSAAAGQPSSSCSVNSMDTQA